MKIVLLLQQALTRLGFLTRVNKKKRRRYLFFSSNKTLYITFVFSAILHALFIYAIPAVELFSEGGTGTEMIVVDFISPEILSTMPQLVDKQFLSATPETPDMPKDPPQTQPVDHETTDLEITIPTVEKRLESSEKFSLEPLDKRSIRDQNPPMQQSASEQQQLKKLTVTPVQPKPDIEQADPIKKPIISPTEIQNIVKKEQPEEVLQFPLNTLRDEDRQPSEKLPKRLTLEKRLTKSIEAKSAPAPSLSDVESLVSKQKRFGMAKQDEDDKNRFGIFAGEKFEIPQMKETVHEAVLKAEKQEVRIKETETARQLVETANEQIEGPVKGRKIVYRPEPPQIDVKIDVELKLKFWVLPDGTIGDVVPLKRGDANLERIAIAYLKKWQFEPLARGESQQDWGTIPIKFTVQ